MPQVRIRIDATDISITSRNGSWYFADLLTINVVLVWRASTINPLIISVALASRRSTSGFISNNKNDSRRSVYLSIKLGLQITDSTVRIL